MSKPFLVLDCNYLCWRAFHSTRSLSFRAEPTGVLYGFFRDVLRLQDLHSTDRIVFCFDYGKNLRELKLPSYKESRRNLPKDKQQERDEVFKQTKKLRKEYLPQIGFRNICFQDGYEADDIIASVCQNLNEYQTAVVVGSDKDLYQLLSPRVSIWDPRAGRAVTEESFSKQFGITPTQWVDVKAIAGCAGDDVPGIDGIGEKTAIKFLQGKLKPGHQYDLIIKGNKIWRRNITLVKLPFAGLEPFVLLKDEVSSKEWRAVLKSLGMRSLLNEVM